MGIVLARRLRGEVAGVTPPPPLSRSARWLGILLMAVAAYAPALRLPFLWDDHVMIENNRFLERWSISNLKHDFSTDVFDGHGDRYYRPAQTLMNRLDYTVYGPCAFGFHLTNLLSHAANAVLFSELVLACAFSPLTALLAGCLFAVHPIGVEQIMIIAGRAEIFSLSFLLAGLLLLLSNGAAWRFSVPAYAIALLFKESALIAPALGAALLFFQRRPARQYGRLLSWIGLSGLYLVLRQWAVGSGLPEGAPGWAARFFIQAFPNVLRRYAGLILAPWNLHSHRMMPHLSHLWPLYLLLLAGLGAWAYRSKRRLPAFAVTWYALSFLPKTPAMMYGNMMLDHWAYPGSLAIFWLLAVFFNRQWDGGRRPLSRALAMLVFPLLIGWALLAHLNITLRGTDEKMYRWALHFTDSHPVHYNLGALLLETGRAQEAIPHLEEVRRVYPDDAKNTYALAKAYAAAGHPVLALRLLQTLISAKPPYPPAVQTWEALHRR